MHANAPPARLPRVRRAAAPAAFATLVVLLASCGGGAGDAAGTGGTVGTLPAQPGCTLRYTLTSSPQLSGADPLFPRQWHLDNAGQAGGTPGEDLRAVAAWGITRGEGARVAVVDDAIETVHEDLAPNVLPGESHDYRPASPGAGWPLPCEAVDDHGTAVAGIVAARDDNAVGVRGVAPRVALVGYNPLATLRDADVADALNRGLAQTGVYQNSWGSPDDGRVNPAEASFDAAIAHGLASGRGGRGAVFVFPGGNGGCYATDRNGSCIAESAGLDGYLNVPGVIAVCTVDHQGRRPGYAETGANLLVCGPGSDDAGRASITTTALSGRYRSDFGGASASAPMVAGVAALVLSANPSLTWRDVRLILAQTARRNQPADPGWRVSGFGPPHHPDFGFGVANAQAAVAAARGWVSVGGSESLRSCGPYARAPGLALPDASPGSATPREDAVQVGPECPITRIEHVEVRISASHPYGGDLRIVLVSPNGLESRLADARVCDGSGDACGAYDDWRFASVRHLGEPAAGAWRLRVTDVQPDDAGTWTAWSLRIWGR